MAGATAGYGDGGIEGVCLRVFVADWGGDTDFDFDTGNDLIDRDIVLQIEPQMDTDRKWGKSV